MRARIIPELDNEWMCVEHALNDPALNPFTASVDEPDFPKTRLVRGAHVLLHNVGNVTRREGVEVERVFDGDFVHHGAF
jgi:hypothetical protein